MWWKRRLDLTGSVYYPGALMPSLESLDGLRVPELSVESLPAASGEHFRAKLRHPRWGDATIHAIREPFPIPAPLIDFGPQLTERDRERARRAGACVLVSMPAHEGDVLRDRKSLLRFLSALLGEDGIVAVDASSQQLWTRERLDEELAHDAPLDVDQIFVLHCVGERDRPTWVHSHGLAEIGFVDFDVLRPGETTLRDQFDLFRALACAILEGHAEGVISLGTHASVQLVDVERFARDGEAEDVALRDDTEGHTVSRRIVCDPLSAKPGFFARLFGRDKPRISSVFRDGIDTSRGVISYSSSMTALMAERARGTFGVFDALRTELAFCEPQAVVKLGYRIDGAKDDEQREHLWFEVHDVQGERIDATLLNEPFNIRAMRQGDRAEHALAGLTDWSLFTPLGTISPRSLSIARAIRENRPAIEAALAELKASEPS